MVDMDMRPTPPYAMEFGGGENKALCGSIPDGIRGEEVLAEYGEGIALD